MDLMLFRITVIVEISLFFTRPLQAEFNVVISEVQTQGRSDFIMLDEDYNSVF